MVVSSGTRNAVQGSEKLHSTKHQCHAVQRPKQLIYPPEEIAQFVAGLIKRLTEEGLFYDGPDRVPKAIRRHLQVRVIPLNNQLRPLGLGFVASTRDISRSGIAIIHHRPLECPFLAVQISNLNGRTLQSAVEVLRCRSLGRFFEAAGKFVTTVYDPIRRVTERPDFKESHHDRQR